MMSRIKMTFGIGHVCIIAFLLRIFHLGKDSLWLDEVLNVSWSAISSAKEIVRVLSFSDNSPPLYYIFLHYWIKLFGKGEFILRLPSALAGTAIVFLIFKIASLIFEKRVAIISAALTAASPFFIWHSQEARMYAFLPMFSLTSLYFLIRALGVDKAEHRSPFTNTDALNSLSLRGSDSDRSNLKNVIASPSARNDIYCVCISKYWIGYVVFSLAALYTHYFAIFTFFAEFAFVLFLRRDILRQYLTACAAIFLSYLPCLFILFNQFAVSGRREAGIFKSTIWAIPHAFFEFSTGYSLLVTELSKFTLKDLNIIIPTGFVFGYIFLTGAFQSIPGFRLQASPARLDILPGRAGLKPQASSLRPQAYSSARHIYPLFLVYLFLPIVASYIVSLKVPIFGSKYLSAPAAIYFIFLGRGLSLQFVRAL